jgi:hypothetical protein
VGTNENAPQGGAFIMVKVPRAPDIRLQSNAKHLPDPVGNLAERAPKCSMAVEVHRTPAAFDLGDVDICKHFHFLFVLLDRIRIAHRALF